MRGELLGKPLALVERFSTLACPSTRNNYNQFISGYYRIVGFEHQISASECKSTFSLVKQLEVSNLNENDQEVNDDNFDINQ